MRMTPTESGINPGQPNLRAAPVDGPSEVVGADPGPTPLAPEADAHGEPGQLPAAPRTTEGRRALREARRERRRLSVWCAVVVAVCLLLTILIVGIARSRSTGPQVVMAAGTLAQPAVPVPASRHYLLTETHGAAAPEGAQP